jgi:hypothetical protein
MEVLEFRVAYHIIAIFWRSKITLNWVNPRRPHMPAVAGAYSLGVDDDWN